MSVIITPDAGPRTNEAWISFRGVSLVRSQRPIVDGIDWTIDRGTHWVVLGANGSGKTTLLRLLAGYLWPTRGEITVMGARFGTIDLRELRKQIGWVGSFLEAQIPFTQQPLDLIISGKYASIGVFEQPREEDYVEARELAHRLGCRHVLELPYGVLSQGEKQRLLIARALINRPRLLILDEACSGLDLVAREQLLHTLNQLALGPDAPTLVLVSHHLEEIMPVFTHVLLLKEGRCLAQGRTGEILNDGLMSRTFGIPVRVVRGGDRYWATGSLSEVQRYT